MRFFPQLSLIALWIAARLVPIAHAEFWHQWDIWQARILTEVGFAEMGGALTAPYYMAGRMPFPTDIAYTNHPYLGVWLYAGLFAMGGANLCFAFLLTLKLGGILACYALLRRLFTSRAAWLATAFFILAPAAMTMDVESNIIGLAATLWPFAAICTLAVNSGRTHPFWLGALVFMGAQISWFFFTLVPALVWLAAPDSARGRSGRHRFLSTPVLAILIGAGLATLVFIGQFIYYVPDLGTALDYLLRQTGGAGREVSRTRMAIAVMFRHLFFLGPGLLLGLLMLRGPKPDRFEARRLGEACLIFLATFLPVEFVLLKFCFIEPSPYAYLLFPMAVLCAAFLARERWRPLVTASSAAAVALAVVATVRSAVPRISTAVKAIAPALARHTSPSEVLFVNLRPQHPPFESWDTNTGIATAVVADRLVFYEAQTIAAAESVAATLKRNYTSGVVVLSLDLPVDGDLIQAVRQAGPPFAEEAVPIPAGEAPPLGARLRTWIWKFTGRYAARSEDKPPSETLLRLQFYRIPPKLVGTNPDSRENDHTLRTLSEPAATSR